MASSTSKVERIAFGSILLIALLMAFGPIVRLHGPNGNEVSNSFNVSDGLTELQITIGSMADLDTVGHSTGSLVSFTDRRPAANSSAIPFSLRKALLVQWFIFAALAFGLSALIDLTWFRKAVGILSLIGACLAGVALLHVMLISSDLQSWTEMLINRVYSGPPDDPRVGGRMLMANSFVVNPGFGLYLMTACFFLVPLLSGSRAIPRLASVRRRDPRVRASQPVRIHPVNSLYPDEICTSLDLSRNGLHLQTPSNHYYVGMEVYLSRNHGANSPIEPEEHGSVVRVEDAEHSGCRIAVRIIPAA